MILRKQTFVLSFLVLLIPFLGMAQINDDFSDGNFTINPTWTGDDSLFRINPNLELQLNDTNASGTSNNSYLSTPSSSIKNAVWEFKFRIKNTTSSQNYIKAFLVSDKRDLSGNSNGYYVQIGNTKDEISLYKTSGGTNSKIIDGRDATTGKSSTQGWIKVTRDSVGNWELFSDTSSTKSGYISEGKTTETSFTQGNYFGFLCKYSSTRKYESFFDSVKVSGGVYGDTNRPFVVNYEVLDSFRFKVQFSEKVEPVTALDKDNYWISQPGFLTKYKDTTAKYVGADSSLVIYTLLEPIGRYGKNQFIVRNINDFSGNKLVFFNDIFTWPIFYSAKKGDILINEIMADPTPVVALPDADWIEIYNNSQKTFNLKNWEFSDRTTTGKVKLPSVILQPGAYAVLCHQRDSAALSAFPSKIIALPSFPNLNNSDDLLSLKDSSGALIDRVEYFDTWYGDPDKSDGGFTLERINPDHPCSGSSNWIGSNSLDGGTPGKQNSVFDKAPETTQPEVVSVKLSGPNKLTVKFSKPLDSLSLTSGKYTITGGLSVTGNIVLAHPSLYIDLILSAPPTAGTIYYLKIENVADCFGNAIKANNSAFGIGTTPDVLEIVINEIFPNPDDSKTSVSSYEYVEIVNRSSKLISLDSCLFSDRSTSSSLQGGLILPNEKIIICEKKALSQLQKYGNVLGLNTWPSLNNSGDLISIKTTNNTLIHLVEYDDDWYQNDDKKAGGWSLEMIDVNNPCSGKGNWRSSIDSKGGTPNADNSIKTLNPSTNGPNLLRANAVGDSSVLLTFDQTVVFADLKIVSFQFSNGLSATKVSVFGPNELLVNLNSTLINRVIYKVEIKGLTNCSGLPIEDNKAEFGLPEHGEIGDIVINEIMFDPYTTAKSDYVELYNRSEKIIDLKNWVLCEFDELKDTLDGCKFITSSSYSLLPKSFVLISKDNSDILKHYPTNDESRFLEIETMPTFSNDEGVVVVINDSLEIVDRLHYNSDWHHVLIKEPDGISLERLDYDRETQDQGNWHSAAKTVGYGTPGLLNSQYFAASDFSENIVIQPETFSPDNDGFEDVLNINYSFEAPGNVANVVIYDAEGRQIIQLTNNELLATQGTITWDGSTDENTKARAGLYIISFEIHDENGRTSQFKKTCVLAIKF